MDEIDAIGGRRFSEGTSADREIQRTLMEVCIFVLVNDTLYCETEREKKMKEKLTHKRWLGNYILAFKSNGWFRLSWTNQIDYGNQSS